MKILFPRKSLHLAIAEIAYIAADVASEEGADHRLHQTFDICEGENIHRVNNLIDLAFSEVAGSLAAVAQPIAAIDPTLHITDKRLHSAAILRIQETAREYIICRVLHGWLSVTLPAAALHMAATRRSAPFRPQLLSSSLCRHPAYLPILTPPQSY